LKYTSDRSKIVTSPLCRVPDVVLRLIIVTKDLIVDRHSLPRRQSPTSATASPIRFWSYVGVIWRHNGVLAIIIGASANMAVKSFDSEAFKVRLPQRFRDVGGSGFGKYHNSMRSSKSHRA
jgi:hypothetical protein